MLKKISSGSFRIENKNKMTWQQNRNLPNSKTTSSPGIFSHTLTGNSYIFSRQRTKSSPRNKTIDLEKITLGSEIITILEQAFQNLQKEQPKPFTKKQLDTMLVFLKRYQVQSDEKLTTVFKQRVLTPLLYQQILDQLLTQLSPRMDKLTRYFESCYPVCLASLSDLTFNHLPALPNLKIQMNSNQKMRLERLWQLTTRPLMLNPDDSVFDTKDLEDAILGVILLNSPKRLLTDIKQLLPVMHRRQMAIVQLILFQLINLKRGYFAVDGYPHKLLSEVLQLLEKHRTSLEKRAIYFLGQINRFLRRCNRVYKSHLNQNFKALGLIFQKNMKNAEVMSFMGLVNTGFNEKKCSEAISTDIASELILASSYFYRTLTLSDLYYPERKKMLFARFVFFTNYLNQELISKLKEIKNDKAFARAVNLLLKVCQKLISHHNCEDDYADLNSLYILSATFDNPDISDRIRANDKISDTNKKHIERFTEYVSPIHQYKNARELAKAINHILPMSPMTDKDFKQLGDNYQLKNPRDCEVDEWVKIANYTKLFRPVHKAQRQLALQTILFNTTIVSQIPEHIYWRNEGDLDLDQFKKFLDKLEYVIDNNRFPIVNLGSETLEDMNEIGNYLSTLLITKTEGPYGEPLNKIESQINRILRKFQNKETTLLTESDEDFASKKTDRLIQVSRLSRFRNKSNRAVLSAVECIGAEKNYKLNSDSDHISYTK